MNKCPLIRAKCPESTQGCPCWTELVMENLESGESKVVKDCLFRLLPGIMIEVIKASNRPAAAIEATRDDLVNSLGAIAHGVGQLQLSRTQPHGQALRHEGDGLRGDDPPAVPHASS